MLAPFVSLVLGTFVASLLIASEKFMFDVEFCSSSDFRRSFFSPDIKSLTLAAVASSHVFGRRWIPP